MLVFSQTSMFVSMLNAQLLWSVLYLFIYLFINLFIHSFIYSFIYLFIYLPFCSQTSILVSTLNVHRLESAGHTVLMNHAVCVSKTAPLIKIQCALPMVQHTTTNAGTN